MDLANPVDLIASLKQYQEFPRAVCGFSSRVIFQIDLDISTVESKDQFWRTRVVSPSAPAKKAPASFSKTKCLAKLMASKKSWKNRLQDGLNLVHSTEKTWR